MDSSPPWHEYDQDGYPVGDPLGTFRIGDEVIGLEDSGAWAHWVEECNDCSSMVECFRLQAEQGWMRDPRVPRGFDPVFLAVCKPCIEARLAYYYLRNPRPDSYDELATYATLWLNCGACGSLVPADDVQIQRGSANVRCANCSSATG
jgi:hypothetical protein